MVGSVSSLQPTTDVAQAKTLIQQAGATGATVQITTITFEPYPTYAKLVQAQLDAIGLNVKIVTFPSGGTAREMYAQGDYAMRMASTVGTAPDPSQIVDSYYLGTDHPGTKDPAEVAKIKQAETLPLGSSERNSAFQDINKDLTTKYIDWVPICMNTNSFAATKSMIGLNQLREATLSQAANYSFAQIAK
jgi:ABC-type transport system substrate-binding protein